jgi:hypothetical protein
MTINQTPAPVAPAAQRFPVALIAVAAVVAILIVVIWTKTHPSANRNEVLALRVTEAIIHNDMSPVAGDFNAATRVKLSNRVTVARLSDDLNQLGKLQRLKEDTPSTSAAGYHHFQAQFEKATWVEDMTYDSEGKILAFHVRAPDPAK